MLSSKQQRQTFLKTSDEYAEHTRDIESFESAVHLLMEAEMTKAIYHAPFQQLISESTVFRF